MILGIVPARRGSEGIRGKNMIDLGGRPLLDYTLATAERSTQMDRIVLSTNMPDAIAWAAEHYARVEAPFVRPEELAESSTSVVDVVLHAIDFLKARDNVDADVIVLLQPTCPFRHAAEIDDAIRLFQERGLNSLIGVSRVWHHPSDYLRRDAASPDSFGFVFREPTWLRRQDFPEVFFITGALYICRTGFLRANRAFFDQQSFLFQMSEETMIDIDSPFDLNMARGLLAIGAYTADGGGGVRDG
jgi:CMP-N,N'-diacetyllegionaminic acid synthase